ncbi:MAG: hypothetical protein E6Q99_10185 [Elusimicrobia bacterium]|nr:MAG: hypothetical protein E6Q99_10185 [Elusimicrobiota bacterium]
MAEALIGAAIVAIVVLAVARLMTGNAKVMLATGENTEASALAQMIETRIRNLPFDDIFSFDSTNKTPVYGANAAQNPYVTFDATNYLIPWSVSRASHTLIELENAVRGAGFSRFTVGVTYLRRDSSNQSGVSGLVEDYLPFSSGNTYGPVNDGCDDRDPLLCFRDACGPGGPTDGKYYDVCGGRPEVPDTGLKMITISVYKRTALMGVKTGTFITRGGMSGRESAGAESPIKLFISSPAVPIIYFQAAPSLKPHLELVTERDYAAGYYGTYALRVDTWTVDATIYNGSMTILQGPPSYAHYKGWTEPGAQIETYISNVWSTFVSSAPGTPLDSHPSDPDGRFDARLPGISGRLMTHGVWNLWTRARGSSLYSPYDLRAVTVDALAPRIVAKGTEGAVNTLSPILYAVPYDDGGGGTFRFHTMIVQEAGLPATKKVAWFAGAYYGSGCPWPSYTPDPHLWYGGNWVNEYFGSDYNAVWSGNPAVHSVMSSGLPWQMLFRCADSLNVAWDPGKTYEVRFETGDRAMYKTSATWSFSTPSVATLAADATPPVFNIPAPAAAPIPWFDSTNPNGNIYTATFAPGVPVAVTFQLVGADDPDSGVDLSTFKMEYCDLALTSCTVFFDQPTSGGRVFGNNFNLYLNRLRAGVTTNFGAPGVGTHDRRIRLTVRNWAGLTTVMTDWRVKIVRN